jgi:hypothetical protein
MLRCLSVEAIMFQWRNMVCTVTHAAIRARGGAIGGEAAYFR